jgi:hypothetical protein
MQARSWWDTILRCTDFAGFAGANWISEAPTGTRYENGKWETNPDLGKVDEIGFTDLMGGSAHGQGGWSRIDWIEVYGVPIRRDGAAKGPSTAGR